MKQYIELTTSNTPAPVKEFIHIWKYKKKYPQDSKLSIGECIELLIATTFNLRYENSDGRFFNKILSNSESVIAWEGEELIDILFFDVKRAILQRLSRSGTFTSETPQ